MKLTNKLRKGALAASLGLVGLTGCAEFEEMSDEYFEQVVLQGAAAKLEKKGEHERARAIRNIAITRGNIAAAEAGRSEVNVYGGGESGRTQNINYSNGKVPDFYVVNYWKDLNENGVPELSEVVGYMGGNKRDFNQEESVSFWIGSSSEGTSLEFKIYNPKGEEIYSQTRPREEGYFSVFPNARGDGGFSPDYFEDKGTYLASYSIDGEFKDSLQFNIH